MSNTDRVRLALIVLEVAFWALAAIYIIFGGVWWHFSGASGGAAIVRALRIKYYRKPPTRDKQRSNRNSDE